MKKLFLIVFAGFFALSFSACQSSENTQSNAIQNNATAEMTQKAIEEDLMKIRKMKSGMKDSSPDAANAPYDLQFLDSMIEHHQSAIDMAKPISEKSDEPKLKAFAEKISVNSNKEIAQMKNWREKWFPEKPAALNMELPGMADSMKGISVKKLDAGGGKQMDLRFIEMMTTHHQGAITLSEEALNKAEHSEIKTLASQIIKAQEAEIKQMQDWKTAWSQ